MPVAVYRMLTLLCTLVVAVPIGTNLGLLHLLWMLVSGKCQNSVHAGVTALLLPTFAAIRGVLRAVVPVQRRDLRCQPPRFRRFAASWAVEHRVLTLPSVVLGHASSSRGGGPFSIAPCYNAAKEVPPRRSHRPGA